MIELLLSFLILFPTLVGWGVVGEKALKLNINNTLSCRMITGVFLLTIIWSIISFFYPLTVEIELVSLFVGISVFFYQKQYEQLRKLSSKETLFFGLFTLLILFCATFPPYILDHFGYYVPTIKWLTEYGLVKGIANLDITLSQTSFWHIFQSGFSHFIDPYLRINAFILIIYILYSVERKQWTHLFFIPILLLFIHSPSPDLTVIIISLITLNEILLSNKNINSIITFSVFVFVIKPTMIWLPILALLYSFKHSKFDYKNYTLSLGILFLYFIKNIWTFGYPLFPIALLDLNLPWKPHPEIMKISAEYALNKSFNNVYTNEEIRSFTFLETCKNWLFISGFKSVINIGLIISLIVFSIFSYIKKEKLYYLILFSIVIKTLFVLLFSAQYRFFIDIFLVIFLVVSFKNIKQKWASLISIVLSVGIVLVFLMPSIIQRAVPSFKLGQYLGKFSKDQFYKPSTYEYKQYHKFKVGNLTYYVSHNYPFNFDTPTPCISQSYIEDYQKLKIFPQLMDSTDLKKGFYWKNLSYEEQNQLEKNRIKLKSLAQ